MHALFRRQASRGQSIAEFVLIVPLMFFLVVAIGDYGRLYATAVAVESAAREAADYGAFLGSAAWDTSDSAAVTANVTEMRRRACTAASKLPDYVGDPVGTPNMDCTNPSFAWDVERQHSSGNCKGAAASSVDPSPCIIHVRLTHTFRMILNIPGLPSAFTFARESRYAVSDLSGS